MNRRVSPARFYRVVLAVAALGSFALQPAPVEAAGVSGVQPGGVYDRPVTVDLLDPQDRGRFDLLLDGEVIGPGTRIEAEGHHLLELRPRGPVILETTTSPVVFSIDTTPPEITFARPPGMPDGVPPLVEVKDANPGSNGPEVLVDGEPYDRSMILDPGEHLMEVEAVDHAGNFAYASESFVTPASPCTEDSYTVYNLASSRLSAAHYFPWYRSSPECPASSAWCDCVRDPKPQNPRPARGFYGSDNQSVTNAQIDQMIAHGVDVVAVEWNGNSFVTNNFLNRVLPAIESRNVQFVLLYDTNIRFGGDPDFDESTKHSQFVTDFELFASSASYFQHPQYLKFANRPVVYVYLTRAIQGADANIQSAFDSIHQKAVDNGFNELYLVADHLYWGTTISDYGRLDLMKPRAATSFAPVDPTQGVSQNPADRPVRIWADEMRDLYSSSTVALSELSTTVDLTPGIFVQYNDSGLDKPECFSRPSTAAWNLLDGSDWSYMIQQAGIERSYVGERHVVLPTCNELITDNGTGDTSIVWTYSYNEWFEGTGLEELTAKSTPYPYGFGLGPLQILQQKLP